MQFLLAHLQRCTAHMEKLTFPWHLLPSKDVFPESTYLCLLSKLIYHFSLYKSSASLHHVSKEKSHHAPTEEQDGAAPRLSGNSYSSRPFARITNDFCTSICLLGNRNNVLFIKLVIEHDNAIYWLSSGAKNSCEA